MADATREKDPLEIAVASPDARVRQMAIRRKEIDVEVKELDMFFDVYAKVAPAPAAPTVVRPVPARKPPPAKVAQNAAQDGRRNCDTVVSVLMRHGPQDLSALFGLYREAAEWDRERSRENFRLMLTRYSDRIGRVSDIDRRYWPVGEPLAEAYAVNGG